jgi:hypothetical protein
VWVERGSEHAFVQWSLGPDPRLWGAELGYDTVEDDDELHQPEKKRAMLDRNGGMLSFRGIANLGCVFLLIIVLLGLLCVLRLLGSDTDG